MCYAAGSIDVQACPMCKVFPHARCPHVKETCRNRALHPRMDVVYIKNAEVDRFTGCGYCKWARSTPPPPPELARYNNPGWPGCCRAPSTTEFRSIPAAEWRAVSIVHQIPIPLDMKAVLDSLPTRVPGPPGMPSATLPSSRTSSRPANDRKNSGGSSPSSRQPNTQSSLSKSGGTTISVKNRPSPSPQPASPNLSRTSSSTAISSAVPNGSPTDSTPAERRQRGVDTPDKRIEGVHSSRSSPTRKNADLDTPKRSSSMRRPAVTPATTSVSVSKVVVGGPTQQGSARRKGSISKPEKREPLPPTPSRTSPNSRPSLPMPPSADKKGEDDDLSSASSSSGSSDGTGSLSDNTVTSDGGFTDYLSDESEAELQRQAEAKAALLAMNMAEEMEFKAARLQLAHVDLRPPKTWNPTNITNTSRTLARVAPNRG